MERVIRLGPCVVLIGAIGLIQAHGIAFWSGKLGPYGIAWSVLLEATALWLWSRPAIGSRALACLASVLLLLGPLYQVGTPILDGLALAEHSNRARSKEIPMAKAQNPGARGTARGVHGQFREASRLAPRNRGDPSAVDGGAWEARRALPRGAQEHGTDRGAGDPRHRDGVYRAPALPDRGRAGHHHLGAGAPVPVGRRGLAPVRCRPGLGVRIRNPAGQDGSGQRREREQRGDVAPGTGTRPGRGPQAKAWEVQARGPRQALGRVPQFSSVEQKRRNG